MPAVLDGEILPPQSAGQTNESVVVLPASAPVEPRLGWSVTEVAKLLGLSRSAAYAAAASGELPTVRIGARIIVPCAALDRLLATANLKSKEA